MVLKDIEIIKEILTAIFKESQKNLEIASEVFKESSRTY